MGRFVATGVATLQRNHMQRPGSIRDGYWCIVDSAATLHKGWRTLLGCK